MKEATRTRLSELILEELSEKIKRQETLRRKLEAFTDLPVEKVAEAILKQFEYLLSSDLRELIVHLIEQEVQEEEFSARAKAESEMAAREAESSRETPEPIPLSPGAREPLPVAPAGGGPAGRDDRGKGDSGYSTESIMEPFGPKEPFPSEP